MWHAFLLPRLQWNVPPMHTMRNVAQPASQVARNPPRTVPAPASAAASVTQDTCSVVAAAFPFTSVAVWMIATTTMRCAPWLLLWFTQQYTSKWPPDFIPSFSLQPEIFPIQSGNLSLLKVFITIFFFLLARGNCLRGWLLRVVSMCWELHAELCEQCLWAHRGVSWSQRCYRLLS